MILADSSVVIECERALTPRLLTIIRANGAVICGITVAEVFAGARNPKLEAAIRATLPLFGQIAIGPDIWEKAGLNQARLRSVGLTVQLQDTIIATVAIEAGIELWTLDAHFTAMAAHRPGLVLFVEPP
ncbi:MAG: PIN domain-containing protein [Gemmataceae bacterium]|nr:PIN domain-containing protein [Gemmataceae bacterium]